MAIIQSFFQSCFKMKFPENKPKLLNSNQVYYQGKITLNRLIQTPSIDDHNFLKWIGLNIKVQILKKMFYLHFAMKCKKIARSPTKGATFAKSYFISRTTFSIVKLCTSRYRMWNMLGNYLVYIVGRTAPILKSYQSKIKHTVQMCIAFRLYIFTNRKRTKFIKSKICT